MTLGRSPRPAAAATALLLALSLPPLLAAPALADVAPREARVVVLSGVVPPSHQRALEARLAPTLARMGISLHSSASATPAFATVSASLGQDSPRVTIVDARGATLSRRDLTPGASLDVHLEEAALIIEAALESALATAPPPAASSAPAPSSSPPVASSSPPLSPPPPASSPPASSAPREAPADPSTAALDVGSLLGISSLAPEAPVRGGVALEVTYTPHREAIHPAISLLGHLSFPSTTSFALVDLEVRSLGARVLPSLRLDQGPVTLEAGLGAGVELMHAIARPRASTIERRNDKLHASPLLTALLGAHLHITQSINGSLLGLVDGDLAPQRYSLTIGPSTETLMQTSRVRFTAMLGLTFSLFGQLHEAPR